MPGDEERQARGVVACRLRRASGPEREAVAARRGSRRSRRRRPRRRPGRDRPRPRRPAGRARAAGSRPARPGRPCHRCAPRDRSSCGCYGRGSSPPSATLPRLMRVLILGGDGYLGWPTALRFSARGHEVTVVDNFVRRRWVDGVGSDSLTPIRRPRPSGIAAWREISGNEIRSFVGSVEDGEFLDGVVAETRPEVGRPLRPAGLGALLDGLARAGGRDPVRRT